MLHLLVDLFELYDDARTCKLEIYMYRFRSYLTEITLYFIIKTKLLRLCTERIADCCVL